MTKTETNEATAELTAVEIASHLGTNPKSLRRFIRNSEDFSACGKGNRYAFSLEDAKRLIEAFDNRPVRNAPAARTADEVAELLA